MDEDMKMHQYFIKVKLGEEVIKVVEVWADNPSRAQLIGLQNIVSQLSSQEETPDETEYRLTHKEWVQLEQDQDELREFLSMCDPYEYPDLREKYKAQREKISVLYSKLWHLA